MSEKKRAAPVDWGGPLQIRCCRRPDLAAARPRTTLSNAGGVTSLRMPDLLGLILLHLVLHGLSLIRCQAEPLCGGDGWVAIRRLPSVIAENRATIALSKGRTGGKGHNCGCKNDRFHGSSPRCWQAT